MIKAKKIGWNYRVVVKCDFCGKEDFATSENDDTTDCTLAHSWIHENNWKTLKQGNKFIQKCDECIMYEQQAKREKYFSK